jgi:hypothetical protein
MSKTSTEEATTQKTEAEMIIETLQTFQETIKSLQAQNMALASKVELLDARVNRELPAQLDGAFKDIQQNFTSITTVLKEMRGGQGAPQTSLATATAEGGQNKSPFQTILETVSKVIEKVNIGGGGGSLNDMDKQILQNSKQIQLLTLKTAYKQMAKSAGVEIADHIVVE